MSPSLVHTIPVGYISHFGKPSLPQFFQPKVRLRWKADTTPDRRIINEVIVAILTSPAAVTLESEVMNRQLDWQVHEITQLVYSLA